MTSTALIVGCGYLGSRVAQTWINHGVQVWATTRTEERATDLEQLGIRPIVWNILDPQPPPSALPHFETALYAVGYERKASYSRSDLHLRGLANVLTLLQASSPSLSRMLFVSTTGVYGVEDGRWVDEDSICEPSTESGQVYVAAERALADSPWGPKSIVLRLAGIYGPGRVPRPQAATEDAGRYLNLVHVDDAVAAVLRVADRAQPPAVFNVADGHPVSRHEFRQATIRLLEPAINAGPEPTTGRLSRQNKRVCNEKICRELDFKFRFPDYQAGLAAIASAKPRLGC